MNRREFQLAFEADICLASARKALRVGPESLRGRAGERAAEVMRRHGWLALAPASDDDGREDK